MSQLVKASRETFAVCQRLKVLSPDIFSAESYNSNQCTMMRQPTTNRARKQNEEKSIISTLLGTNISDTNIKHVKVCFTVPDESCNHEDRTPKDTEYNNTKTGKQKGE